MIVGMSEKTILTYLIHVNGRVQGVGFRPFVFRLAIRFNLKGYVKNVGCGVEIMIQGELVDSFISAFKKTLPPLAIVDEFKITKKILKKQYTEFVIQPSSVMNPSTDLIPDITICDGCLKELIDPLSRYYRYPFISCTNCGPRYSITEKMPFDRIRTAMKNFSLCQDCEKEYHTPTDKRFHAQTIACVNCGPKYSFDISDVLQNILAGKIIAIKSLGGFQLICDASNHQAVKKLRKRKKRSSKPFALMALNKSSISNFVELDENSLNSLQSRTRPIVLLKKHQKNRINLTNNIAPGMNSLGIMLPYSAMHYLLFYYYLLQTNKDIDFDHSNCDLILVVTSANSSDEPILIDNDEANKTLCDIADIIVTFNRDIINHADDSIVSLINAKPSILRGGRGITPLKLNLVKSLPPILALGAELKNTITCIKNDFAFISPHVGNIINKKGVERLKATINTLTRNLNISPVAIAHDCHPNFLTTYLAGEFNLPCYPIQHHHAHIAAVACEHGFIGKALGLALDGYGYGYHGEAWGGELILYENTQFQHLGSLQKIPMPGGDKAARAPWRMALSILYQLDRLNSRCYPNSNEIIEMLDKNIHCPLSSSCGRYFDAASSLLNIIHFNEFEGHAAMALEKFVTLPQILDQGFEIINNQLNILPLFKNLIDIKDKEQGANLFHGTLANGLSRWVTENMEKTNISTVIISGGCWQNKFLTETFIRLMPIKSKILLPRMIPFNDANISLGQAFIAGLDYLEGEQKCV